MSGSLKFVLKLHPKWATRTERRLCCPQSTCMYWEQKEPSCLSEFSKAVTSPVQTGHLSKATHILQHLLLSCLGTLLWYICGCVTSAFWFRPAEFSLLPPLTVLWTHHGVGSGLTNEIPFRWTGSCVPAVHQRHTLTVKGHLHCRPD